MGERRRPGNGRRRFFVTQAIPSASGRTRCGEPASSGNGLLRER